MKKTATVADLRNNFAAISQWISNGETFTITKRGQTFATLSPVHVEKTPAAMDYMGRLREMYPDGPAAGDIQDVIELDRGNT